MNKEIKKRKERRIKRTRNKILETTKLGKRLRLSIFRSNKYLYAQIIDDANRKTLLSGADKNLEKKEVNKVMSASEFGKVFAEQAKKIGVKEVVFDKGAYKYHGRVKAFAESLREGGLVF